ncbi:MATE family efflux transporter [Marinobacterium halophilum]|uniref:MATE family efflux transporter n=1 Tax=Marinobacterium halophilum TaxID=267374 RepID=UPI001FE3B59D|nr:MATE family efflux transporter [Marinobacterium halophilum]
MLQLGWPIMVAQLAQNAMGFIDTLMSARAGTEDLAAIALGSSLWLPVFLALAGVLMATTPMVAHLVGANDEARSRSVLHQAFWVAALLSLIGVVLLRNAEPLLAQLQLAPALQAKTQAYLDAISWGFPAFLFYQVIRSFSEGFGKTHPVMRIAVLGMLCNIPLNYILIFGKFGLPALGGVGCGYATAIVMWVMLLTGIFYLLKSTRFKPLKLLSNWQPPAFTQLLHLLKLGIPIGFSLLIEASMFCVLALILAPQGEITIAANQITISYTGMIFMVPLSIAMALTIRVGQLVGRGDPVAARFAANTGIFITLFIATFSCVLSLLLARQIALLYTPVEEIVVLAATLISIGAVFQFSDALQVSAAGALRGYKDTAIPLVMVFIAYWLIGLPVGYILAFTDWVVAPLTAAGLWYGLLIGLSAGAVLLTTRLMRITRHAIDTTDHRLTAERM